MLNSQKQAMLGLISYFADPLSKRTISMSAFDEVREQIDWAKMCLDAANVEITDYIQNNAFAVLEETDPHTGEHVRKVKLVNPIPISIKGRLRNAILDLRHSFDMSLHAAATTCGVSRFDKNFPWADSPTGVRTIIDSWQRKVKTRLPEVIVNEIFRQEPHSTGEGFAGGNDLVREIAKMANNKHSIGITASAQVASVHVKARLTNVMSFTSMEPWDPVKKELVISRHIGSASYDDPAVTGNVFFKRVGRLGMRPAFPTSMVFYNRAKLCLEGFEAASGIG